MQAIQTKILSTSRGQRIRVESAAKTIIMPWDDRLGHAENHREAAESLVEVMSWTHPNYGTLVSGTLADGSFVHVMSGRNGMGDI